MVRACPAARPRHAVPRPLSAGAPSADPIRVEDDREQPARPVLRIDASRAPTTRGRAGAVAPHVPRRQPGAGRDDAVGEEIMTRWIRDCWQRLRSLPRAGALERGLD